jgi:hypothetical protein
VAIRLDEQATVSLRLQIREAPGLSSIAASRLKEPVDHAKSGPRLGLILPVLSRFGFAQGNIANHRANCRASRKARGVKPVRSRKTR